MPPKSPRTAELANLADYEVFDGVAELVRTLPAKAVRAHKAYERGNTESRAIAEHILDMRRHVISSVHGLPDLKGGSPAARSAYADMMSLTEKALGITDRARLDTAMSRIKNSVRHYQRQVLVDYIRALRPGDPDTKQILGTQAHVATDENVTRMIYEAYERVGVELPAETREEIQRERREASVIGPADVVNQAQQLASAVGVMAQTAPAIRWDSPSQARAFRAALAKARKQIDELEGKLG